jgi:hypothetical protein
VCCNDVRSPFAIVDVINALSLAEGTLEAHGPYVGEFPTFRATMTSAACVVRRWRPCVGAGSRSPTLSS